MWVNHAMHFKPTLDRVNQTCARIRCFDIGVGCHPVLVSSCQLFFVSFGNLGECN